MDPITDLGTENVIDQLVLGDPGQTGEDGRSDLGPEMLAIAADRRRGVGDAGLDAFLQFLWRDGHATKRSARFTE